MTATILWLRQDLRIIDHPALSAAVAEGAVIPVYILDDIRPQERRIGAAQRWWLHHSLAALDRSIAALGGRLILRRGDAVEQLVAVAVETGARRVHATHHYEPWHKAAQRDLAQRLDLVLHHGACLVPPERVLNGQGERYRVFTPWYRRMREALEPAPPLPAPKRIPAPDRIPHSERLEDWDLRPTRPDWARGFVDWTPGEAGALRALESALPMLGRYKADRDRPSLPATSRLSPHLHFGEISPRTIWSALGDRCDPGVESFRSELGWREHGMNLLDQIPDYGERYGRDLFGHFPWREGAAADRDFRAWSRGETGYPVVDAGMRELWRTGWMHNRVRMIVASFLVKHLLIDWRRGERWFWDTLLDADLGSNAMNWQYVAGTGVDAPAFSRIMSPRLQSEKFDMTGYVRANVPELAGLTDAAIHEAHLSGARTPGYPQPIVSHETARARALAAWGAARGLANWAAEAISPVSAAKTLQMRLDI
jgi:deoxyribodipyrimidine photo-lyase